MPTETDTGGVTYLEAIGAAMMSEMEADPDVFLIGEDVGQFGGAFKVTKGFLEKFGPRRVVDTPIAETGFTGPGGRRSARRTAPDRRVPVRRLHLVRFRSHHQRDGAPSLPHRRRDAGHDASTVRCATARRADALPERRVLFRARPRTEDRDARTPQDAAGLLISAIRDNNPVLYLENKYLYRRLRSDGPINLDPIPLGQANVVREGRDVTLITYSAGVSQGIEIADELDKEGISVEVVDIRTLVPLDIDTIVTSVKKTAKAVVLHEAARRLGYGAEIAAEVQERCFWHLDWPVVRIAAKNTPTPTSPPLEDAVVPQPAEIAETLREVARA